VNEFISTARGVLQNLVEKHFPSVESLMNSTSGSGSSKDMAGERQNLAIDLSRLFKRRKKKFLSFEIFFFFFRTIEKAKKLRNSKPICSINTLAITDFCVSG